MHSIIHLNLSAQHSKHNNQSWWGSKCSPFCILHKGESPWEHILHRKFSEARVVVQQTCEHHHDRRMSTKCLQSVPLCRGIRATNKSKLTAALFPTLWVPTQQKQAQNVWENFADSFGPIYCLAYHDSNVRCSVWQPSTYSRGWLTETAQNWIIRGVHTKIICFQHPTYY